MYFNFRNLSFSWVPLAKLGFNKLLEKGIFVFVLLLSIHWAGLATKYFLWGVTMSQQRQVGITTGFSWFFEDFLCLLDGRLRVVIRLMMAWTRGHVFESVLPGEGFKFSTSVLWTTVWYHFVRNAISSHVRLQLLNHSRDFRVIQPVNFDETRKVIYWMSTCNSCGLTQTGLLKFRPTAIGNIMTYKCLLLLSGTICRTCFAPGSKIFYITLHVWPVNPFSGRLRVDSILWWPECGAWSMRFRRVLGIMSLSSLKNNPSKITNSSRMS